MTQNPIIIVGGGWAGATLSARLQKYDAKTVVFDAPDKRSATRVAAGLYNTVTGKRVVKTWMADVLTESLENFFDDVNAAELKRFLFATPVYRPFKDVFEYNEWSSADFSGFIRIQNEPFIPDILDNPLGGFVVNRTGRIDLAGATDGLLKRTRLVEEFLPNERIFLKEKYVLTRDGERIDYSAIVFCEGIAAAQNPLFQSLNFIPLKGHILELESEIPLHGHILVKNRFLAPINSGRFLYGSTYEREFISEEIDPACVDELTTDFQETWKNPVDFEVSSVKCGFRSSTPDRRPYLLKSEKDVYLFNGLGTKGALIAPYFSDRLARTILFNEPLPDEVNATRFLKRNKA